MTTPTTLRAGDTYSQLVAGNIVGATGFQRQSRDDGGRPTDRSPIGAVGAC